LTIIHTHMYVLYMYNECLKETPYVAILNKQKCHFFPVFFSFTKSENRWVEQVLSRWVGTSGRGEEVEKW
jgi:hypothetical protein